MLQVFANDKHSMSTLSPWSASDADMTTSNLTCSYDEFLASVSPATGPNLYSVMARTIAALARMGVKLTTTLDQPPTASTSTPTAAVATATTTAAAPAPTADVECDAASFF
jgi:hypothetical protein